MSAEAQSGRQFFVTRRPLVTGLIVLVTIIATLYSVILFGATSREQPIGSLTGVRLAVDVNLESQGIPLDELSYQAVLSSVDKHWAMFVLTPTAKAHGTLTAAYGFAHFTQHAWQIVDSGSSNVGCPTSNHRATVPDAIRSGFGERCFGE